MNRKTSPKSTWAAVAVAAVAVTVGLTGCGSTDTTSAATTSAATETTAAKPTETPQQAEARKQAAATAEQARKDAAAAEVARRQAVEAAKRDPASYEQLTDRDFALLVKNPDTATGRKIVVYGRISQFDSATGPTQFLARTAPEPQSSKYDYDQNTMIVGDTAALIADVVEDDLVTMHTEVIGSYTYDTQAGGSTTVPKLKVNIIEVTG